MPRIFVFALFKALSCMFCGNCNGVCPDTDCQCWAIKMMPEKI